MGYHHKPDRHRAQTDTNLYVTRVTEKNNENCSSDNTNPETGSTHLQHSASAVQLRHRFFRNDSSRESLRHPHRNMGMPHLPRVGS